MAQIAAKNSDKVILTSDNPRTENPEAILDEMMAGLKPENMAVYHNLKSILINSYDNAITFTDYFIELVLRELEATGRSAVLVYVGDHGENLLDDERNMFLHGTYGGSEYEYHVPLFVWTSPQYARLYPKKIQTMRNNTKKCFTTMTIFHSLLDLGNIYYEQLDSTQSIVRTTLCSDSIIYGLDANMLCTPLPISHNNH
jgi:glucan phosphoethanolaminetransferase (alkaline phosphatase superfamily)